MQQLSTKNNLFKLIQVLDSSQPNLSRSTVPKGLHILDNVGRPYVITSQKFAKGSRFGPLLARKSNIPIENVKFPLILFGNTLSTQLEIPELNELFKVRNIYLDTTNENSSNWMIHVSPAIYSNEQNLIAYQVKYKI